MSLQTVSLKQRPDLFKQQDVIGANAWPRFMLQDPVAISYWAQLVEAFPEYQLMLMEREKIVAVINSVPLSFDQDLTALPQAGVEWGVVKSVSDFNENRQSNFVMAVQVVIPPRHQGKGLSSNATRAMLNLAKDLDMNGVIVPLRPSQKHLYPLIPMEDYLQWKNADGLPFDSWLRVHVKLGGEVIKICNRSMQIPGTVKQWENWTGQSFPETGTYIVPGAICPVVIDLQSDLGTYTESNIWVVHRLSSKHRTNR